MIGFTARWLQGFGTRARRARRPFKLRPSTTIARAAIVALTAALAGCGDGRGRPDAVAVDAGLTRLTLVGEGFRHIAWASHTAGAGGTRLHVYLDGDGSPWVGGRVIASDPTPRNPLVLRLLALDPEPALYLGRPCYHGLAREPRCGPALWTDARYSEPVVASMTAALRRFIDDHQTGSVVLIGYSGGGVLAWLIAERLAAVQGLVTVAANLDVDAWTAYHGYQPLVASLNPAQRGPLPARIAQLHVLGSRDTNVPVALNRAVLARGAGPVQVRTLAGDHSCCWERHWPGLLAEIARLGDARSTQR